MLGLGEFIEAALERDLTTTASRPTSVAVSGSEPQTVSLAPEIERCAGDAG